MNCSIKAVFFDIGNVLLNFDPHAVLREIAGVLGRPPRQVARFFEKPGRIEALERGELSIEGLYHIFQKDLGYQGSYPRFKKLWCDHFTLDRSTAALLKEVAGRLPTYLLSNTNALHYEFIRARYAFTRHVRGAVLSHEIGMRKPEPRIYAAALKLARLNQPGQALFIDDLKPNVAAARRAGLLAILYRGPEDLRRRLRTFGVLD